MQSTTFYLENGKINSRRDEHGNDSYEMLYEIPVLPAYAITHYHIDALRSSLDGEVTFPPSSIVGSQVIIPGADGVSFKYMYHAPVLTIYHIGIRDYQLLFPDIGDVALRKRMGEFMEEADKTFSEGAWLSFVIMAGAVFEGRLADLLKNYGDGLGGLIKKIVKLEVMENSEVEVIESVKNYRNLVHAGKYIGDLYVTRNAAMTVRLMLDDYIKKDWLRMKREIKG